MNKQNIEVIEIEKFGEKELIERLKKVTMLEDQSTFPYKDAFISTEKICTEDLFPPQRYVLKPNLLKVRELKWALEKFDADIFDIKGFIRMKIKTESGIEDIDILPPVVEEFIEKNGRVVNIINDGMHRVYCAYMEWTIPRVIFIRGLPKALPYYSFPIPEKDWTKIELIDSIDKNFIKKWHRTEENKKLYRNFNSAFKNVGGPRGSGK